MNVRLPPLDLFWSQAWNAFGPYLVPTLIAAALLVLLLLLGRKDGADGHAPPSAGSRTEGIARRARPAEVIPHAAAPAASRAPLVATPAPRAGSPARTGPRAARRRRFRRGARQAAQAAGRRRLPRGAGP
ncbi:hypothetical protein [Aquincola sp. J276]|uniref:hypothetical protein n=1 Tax=Aquincola sp. J276 TaxID=2898432 RepID=UPI002150FB57|nr:hypothetical protein [Aquincola sp. J276]MCR5863689.1 hypothetical protein [Aquincola sp. J276]